MTIQYNIELVGQRSVAKFYTEMGLPQGEFHFAEGCGRIEALVAAGRIADVIDSINTMKPRPADESA